MARAGETIVVPAGVPHSEGNPGPAEIEGVVELRPALHTKEWHEALAGLVADGKTTPRGGDPGLTLTCPGWEVSSATMSAADCACLARATPCPAHIESASISPVVPTIGGAGS